MNLTLNNILINLGIKDYDYIFDNKYFDVCENEVVYGNITLSDELLDKYNCVKEIFSKEKSIDCKIEIENNVIDKLSLSLMNKTDIYHEAVNIFKKNHISNTFINNGNKIIVSNTDIKESINKINNSSLQRKYILEHLIVFSQLGKIIKNAVLVNQTLENKNREQYKFWNYYLIYLKINDKDFLLEFDVISKNNGENHYRLQRLEEIKKQILPSGCVK